MRKRGRVFYSVASMICCHIQDAVGCAVTFPVDQLTTLVRHHDEHIQGPKRERLDGEEIGCPYVRRVNAQECPPARGRRARRPVPVDRCSTHVDPEGAQLVDDPLRPPPRVFGGQPDNQRASLGGDVGTARPPWAASPAPRPAPMSAWAPPGWCLSVVAAKTRPASQEPNARRHRSGQGVNLRKALRQADIQELTKARGPRALCNPRLDHQSQSGPEERRREIIMRGVAFFNTLRDRMSIGIVGSVLIAVIFAAEGSPALIPAMIAPLWIALFANERRWTPAQRMRLRAIGRVGLVVFTLAAMVGLGVYLVRG